MTTENSDSTAHVLMAANGWFAPTVLASFAEFHLVDAPPSFRRTFGFRYRHGSIAHEGTGRHGRRPWRCDEHQPQGSGQADHWLPGCTAGCRNRTDELGCRQSADHQRVSFVRSCLLFAGFCPRCLGQEVGLADARRKVHQTAGYCIDLCRLSGCKSKSRNPARHLGLQLHS